MKRCQCLISPANERIYDVKRCTKVSKEGVKRCTKVSREADDVSKWVSDEMNAKGYR